MNGLLRMSLAESLERAAVELPEDADVIRPANGDPVRLFELLPSTSRKRVLAWLLANAIEDGEELALAWIGEVDGADDVAALEGEALPKPGRKTLRRLLHRARSQGLIDDASAEVSPRIARLAQADETISAGFIAPHDPRGGRLVYLVESSPAGGARVFEALLDEDRGVVDFQVYRAGRRQVKSFIRDVTHRENFSAVEADAASVRALIARRAGEQPDSRPFPASFKEWRGRLGLSESNLSTPGEQVRAGLSAKADAESVQAVQDDVEAGRMGPWPPQPAVLEGAMKQLRTEFLTETGNEDSQTDDKALTEAVHSAVTDLYVNDLAPVNAERMEESAYLFWKGEKVSHAEACLASAEALRADPAKLCPIMEACVKIVGEALAADLLRSGGEGTENPTAPGSVSE